MAQQKKTPQEHRAHIELTCLILRALKRFSEAAALYRQNGDRFQAGYCDFLIGNLNATQTDWGQVLQKRSAHWCQTLYGLATYQLNSYASMLQIRNNLEGDVGNFLLASRWDYLQNVIFYTDILTQMNLESPKFIGRGILNYLLAQSKTPELLKSPLIAHTESLLLKGQKVLPNDPEIYYHLGQFRHLSGDDAEARLMLKQCLLISPSYTPVKDLMSQLH
ncbi:MAG: hypothetical protein VKJ04_06315 [Vampirovibrionales bacterium]|nr:hypothetical protein [Vampirovibrionales bacterium]